MQKAVILTAVLLVLSGCGQTDNVSNAEQQKPQSATKVSSKVEDKPAPAPRVTELAKINQTELGLETVSQEKLNSLRAKVTLIEQANECDSNAQCKVIAAGNRPCGGPSHYMLYSTKITSDEKAKSVADELTKYESLHNAQTGMQSICAMLTKPTTQCINNKCVTLSDSTYIAQ